MPRFSEYFSLNLSQHQLDFVDVSNSYDTPVFVDPFAIEIRNDIWAAQASESIRVFFKEVLDALRNGDNDRAENLMSHLQEPRETFLGVSSGPPKGRGVGSKQAKELISSIKASTAYATGLLSDLSEMALYVVGVDRDKISDLTTNIIRELLVDYTQEQCELHDIETRNYNGPPVWDNQLKNWVSKYVQLPFIDETAILLVPKYIVRRRLSLDSQEFYDKQITDFLVSENLKANSSLVQTIKGKKKVFKGDVRKQNPKSKALIANMVKDNPEILELYKELAKTSGSMTTFVEGEISVNVVCNALIKEINTIPTGSAAADRYHNAILGALTVLFYPDLIQPRKEWPIHSGRKRIDIVFTNAADTGFFAHRRDGTNTQANTVIVECKNYTDDIANEELDQLLGRFDNNRGKFGIMTCRAVKDQKRLDDRCRDMSSRSQGFIVVLTDDDILGMLDAKANLKDEEIGIILHRKFRKLLE